MCRPAGARGAAATPTPKFWLCDAKRCPYLLYPPNLVGYVRVLLFALAVVEHSSTFGSGVPHSGFALACLVGSLALDDKDGLYWLEGRPQEKGRQAVVRYEPSSPSASERGAVDVTPSDVNVRTRVHEYGGGAYAMAPSSVGGGVVYSDFVSQRLYHLKGDGSAPVCLTPI